MKKYLSVIFFVLCFSVKSQNIFKILENTDSVILAEVDSIYTQNKSQYAIINQLSDDSNKTYIVNLSPTRATRRLNKRNKIKVSDTIVIFSNFKNGNDTLMNSLVINKNPQQVYNSILKFEKLKRITKTKKRLKAFKEWFVSTSKNEGIKAYLSRIMRKNIERNYFFNLIRLSEEEFIFNNPQKSVLIENISESRCLKFEDFYIVYLMRYSYDSEFEEELKNIMSTYCLPFGDAHLNMMETILYNNKENKNLQEIYTRFKKQYYSNIDIAKKTFDEFLNKI